MDGGSIAVMVVLVLIALALLAALVRSAGERGQRNAERFNDRVPFYVAPRPDTPPPPAHEPLLRLADLWQFRAAGIAYESRNGNVSRSSIARELKPGMSLRLRREPQNEFDPDAIAIYPVELEGGADLDMAFVPKAVAALIAPLMDRYAVMEAHVMKVVLNGPHDHFVHVYVEVRMTAPPEPLPPKPPRVRRKKLAADETRKEVEA